MGHAVYDLYYWVADGINEKGLSISQASNGGEYFWQDPYPEEPAVFSSRMARLVMDTCADVDEALRLIGSVRIWFPNQGLHWLLADAKGRSVVVEFDLNRKMVVFDREDPYELVTNTALQKGEEYILKNCWRYRTAKTMLEAGIQGTGDIGSIMTAIRPTTGGSRTVWTCLMDLQARSFEAYYFKEFDRKYEFRHPFRLWLPIVASPAGMQFSDDRQSPWSTDHNHRRRESP